MGRRNAAGTSNRTNERGVFGGGYSWTNVIDYITISTTGNATDLADLTVTRSLLAADSNSTNERGVWGGGAGNVTYSNVMDYKDINTSSNAVDFGDLTRRMGLTATSNT